MTEGTSPSKEKAEGFASVFSVVPAIYYDLIARIVPGIGFLFIINASLSIAEKETPKTPLISDFLAIQGFAENVLVLLVLSYLIGMVLTGASPVWDALSFLWFKLFRLGEPLGLRTWCFTHEWANVAERMERTIKASDSAGAIVTKALAELALCQNLLTGCVILAVLGAVTKGPAPSFLDHIATYSIVFVALLFSMLFRYVMFLGRVKTFDKLYGEMERRELLVGRAVIQVEQRGGIRAPPLMEWLDAGLHEPRDREFFGLRPRPASTSGT